MEEAPPAGQRLRQYLTSAPAQWRSRQECGNRRLPDDLATKWLSSWWPCRPQAWEGLSWARPTGPEGSRKSRKTISVSRGGPSQVHCLDIPRSRKRIVGEQSKSSWEGQPPPPHPPTPQSFRLHLPSLPPLPSFSLQSRGTAEDGLTLNQKRRGLKQAQLLATGSRMPTWRPWSAQYRGPYLLPT